MSPSNTALMQGANLLGSSSPARSALAEARHLLAAGYDAEAAQAFERAVELDPADPDGWAEGAALAWRIGLRSQAERAWQRALELDPGHREARLGLGRARLELGGAEVAAAIFSDLLKEALIPEAARGLALCRQRQGDDAGAASLLQSWVDERIGPGDLAATWASSALRLGRALEVVRVLRTWSDRSPTLLHVLGEAWDSLGRPDRAWSCWAEGNGSRGLEWSVGGDALRLARIRRSWSGQTLARIPVAAVRDERPVFIVGMPRSGGALLEQMLGCHSGVHASGELDLIPRLSLWLPRQLGLDAQQEDWQEHLDQGAVDHAARLALDELCAGAGEAERVIDRRPDNAFHLGLISRVLPGARVLRLVRDPDDVALSCFRAHFESGESWAASVPGIRRRIEAEALVMEHWRACGAPAVHTVRYEDLVTDPKTVLRKALSFLGLPWQGAVLRPELAEQNGADASVASTRRAVHTGSMGRSRPYRRWLRG